MKTLLWSCQHRAKHWTRKQHSSTKSRCVLVLHPTFRRFSPFNCCLSVVLQPDKSVGFFSLSLSLCSPPPPPFSFWLQATYLSFKCINEVKPGTGNFTDQNQLLSYSSPTVVTLDEGYRTSNIGLKIWDE